MPALNHILLAILLTTAPTTPPSVQTQSDSIGEAKSASEPESAPVLYDTIKYSAQGQGATTRKTLDRLGIPTIPIAYHGGVDWNQDGEITPDDRRLFRKWVDATIPVNATGPAVMDYEQPWWDELSARTLEPEKLESILKIYIDGLAEAKSIRPKLQWGYWGLPTMRNVSKGWSDQGLSVEPLMNASGAIYPSAYDCNPDLNSEEFKRHIERVLEANRGERPVIVFLNLRFCGQNKDRTKFIPIDELLENAHAVLEATWTDPEGTVHRIDGITLWDAYIWSEEEDWPALDRLHSEAFSKLHSLVEIMHPDQPSSPDPPEPRGEAP